VTQDATPQQWDPEESEQQGPVVRDRRRIDPVTGEVRAPQGTAPAGGGSDTKAGPADAEPAHGEAAPVEPAATTRIAELEQEVQERLEDLRRLQAEYVNYKRRVDRDREVVRHQAVSQVLTALLPVLDDVGRAREHGELDGGFKAVADALESVLAKQGLERYGEPGDPFDPRIHEALMHQYSDEVDGPTCLAILQPGYRHGDRILRPTRVAVAEPTVDLPKPESTEAPANPVAAAEDVEQPPPSAEEAAASAQDQEQTDGR